MKSCTIRKDNKSRKRTHLSSSETGFLLFNIVCSYPIFNNQSPDNLLELYSRRSFLQIALQRRNILFNCIPISSETKKKVTFVCVPPRNMKQIIVFLVIVSGAHQSKQITQNFSKVSSEN